MKNYRQVAVVMLLALVLNVFGTIFTPVAAAHTDHSHVNSSPDHELTKEKAQVLMPENSVIWEMREFLAWAEVSGYQSLARQASEPENTAIVVFT